MSLRKLSLVAAMTTLATLTVPVSMLTACAQDRGSTQRSAGEVIDDATITTRVKAALVKDPQVKGLQVNVTTREGIVQLSGFADTRAEARRAEDIAAGVPGVKSVKNDIRMKSAS